MWIFTVAPEFAIHLVFALGVLGLVASFIVGLIPAMKPYKLAVQIASLVILCLGVYLEGGLSDYKEWEFKANELKAKIASMEKDMANSDTKVVEKVVVQKQVVREKGKDVIRYVDREIVKYDEKFIPGGDCALPLEFFKAYNESLGKDQK